MLDRMQSRGPDGEGVWPGMAAGRDSVEPSRSPVLLGHKRLAIIDLSEAGAQPMSTADGRLVVTFNGEIYNYQSLRAELEAKGCQFRSHSDTEVLLHLYRLKGPQMVEDLRGMFTFALWDDEKKGLLLARDHFGIKPLYFADDGRTLRAASQVKALVASRAIDTAPDPAGHVGFFLWGHIPDPFTLYRNIRALPAGHTLWIDQNGTQKLVAYRSVPQILAGGERQAPKQKAFEALERVANAAQDTVRHHLIADVPVGIFLSSGLDSTCLTAIAAGHCGELRTVTLGFEEYRGSPNDETSLAEQVAGRYGARHQTIWISRNDFQAHYQRLFESMDQPSTDGVNTYFVSLAASRAGLKVALSGLGGDEILGGYPGFTEIPRAVKTFSPFQHVPFLGKGFRIVTHPLFKQFTSPKYAGIFELGGTFPGAYLLRRGMFMPWELPEILDPDLVEEGWRELRSFDRLNETLGDLKNAHVKVACLELCWYMRNQLLRDSDWASMAHSLELRVPLVDVKFLGKMAPLMAAGRPPTKRDVCETLAKPLPPEIVHRRKTGFQIPVREWLSEGRSGEKRFRGLRGWAHRVYSEYTGN